MKLKKNFSPFWWTEFGTLLLTLTNDHNFHIVMVSFGGEFYNPDMHFKLFFNCKQTKLCYVDLQPRIEVISTFFKYLVHILKYRWKCNDCKQRPLYFLDYLCTYWKDCASCYTNLSEGATLPQKRAI